jgi:hypothetical protein
LDLSNARLANTHLLAAIRSVAYVRQDQALHRIDYRNLGSEELGSVYESLLELQPELDPSAGTFSLGHASGNERKTSGSYYTPTSLISTLLDGAFEPVIDEAASKADLEEAEEALLDLKVLDPACGSGHFLVAAAHRIARRLAMLRSGETDPAPDVFRHALREVIGRCVFGIDLNPMAVELCKVSLWLESVEPGKPLSFLDHHVVCGNSLLGTTPEQVAAGIPDEAYKPLSGDVRGVVSAQRRRNAAERGGQTAFSLWQTTTSDDELAKSMADIDQLRDDDIADIAEKQTRWHSVVESDAMTRARFAANAWCSAFVVPKDGSTAEITTSSLRRALDHGPGSLDPQIVETVNRLADEYRFLHLHTTFPQVFSEDLEEGAERGSESGSYGFDAVLGNPPWERVKLSEKEFFATLAPEITEAAGTRRRRMIAALAESEPELYAEYEAAVHHAEAESAFLRSSGCYPLTGRGDVNTYAVFSELMRTATGPTGRCGVIAPTGIATDDTTKYFFADIVTKRSLVSLYDFENREGIFPAIDSRIKFCLLTMTGVDRPARAGAEFAFFCHQTEDLRDEGRRFALTPAEMHLVNPNTRTCPIFRSRRDAELTLGIYRRVPVLIAEGPPDVNPWSVKFMRMFDMTNDSGLFRTATECELAGAVLDGNVYRHLDGRIWLPLYEGRMGHQFDHRFASQGVDGGQRSTAQSLADPSFVVMPAVWIAEPDFLTRAIRNPGLDRPAFLGFRRVARNTDERTVIATLMPRGPVSYGWILSVGPSSTGLLHLLANYNSFVFDYVARNFLSQPSFPQSTFEQLPALPPFVYEMQTPWDVTGILGKWIGSRALELVYTAWDLDGFAKDLAYDGPPFTWNEERRSLLRAELDACFFHLYGIERDDVVYVMDAFPIVRRKDDAACGEYRTARLILERYDEMAKAIESGAPYRGILE